MIVASATPDDRAWVINIGEQVHDSLCGTLPTETDRPGINSCALYGLMHAAALVVRDFPADKRGQAIEAAQSYLMSAAKHFATVKELRENPLRPTSGIDRRGK